MWLVLLHTLVKSELANAGVQMTMIIASDISGFNYLKIKKKKFFLFFSKVLSDDFPRPHLAL